VSPLTCADAAELLDPFVDAELPGPMLLAVARHAGACTACDGELRERSALHDALERTLREASEGLDLSPVWPAVATRAAGMDLRRTRVRQLRRVPAWAAVAALAAGAVFWLRVPPPVPAPELARVAAARPRPNRAVIDRLRSEGARVALRSERKNGTMLIMVDADAGEALP
jgi:anti-sigma factor RsiW